MTTKLTLRLDKELIQAAKEYAGKTGKSLSRIVADYFQYLKNEKLDQALNDAPATCSLKGILKNTSVSEGDYREYLKDKYL